MIIFPALDLQNGNAVRLAQGKRDNSTIYGTDPLTIAKQWQATGSEWLHIVDLDGAFDGASQNSEIIKKICAETDLKIQVGGGIRDVAACKRYLDAGAERVILGTLALEQPQLFAEICQTFPGQAGVSLDAENGRLKGRGWLADSGKNIHEIIPAIEDAGAAFIIYTDINRDGMETGPNLDTLSSLLERTSIPVIAAGGVGKFADIKNVFSLSGKGNLEGVITGRAIYEKTLDLAEALSWLKAQV